MIPISLNNQRIEVDFSEHFFNLELKVVEGQMYNRRYVISNEGVCIGR
jgi:hypothetical protein